MFWYGVLAVVCIAVVVSGRLCLEVASLRKLVRKQNGLLKGNLAELRDEYARLNREMKKDKKAGKN